LYYRKNYLESDLPPANGLTGKAVSYIYADSRIYNVIPGFSTAIWKSLLPKKPTLGILWLLYEEANHWKGSDTSLKSHKGFREKPDFLLSRATDLHLGKTELNPRAQKGILPGQ